MYDASGNAIPIRWLAPECVELSDDNDAVSLRSITKECNLWLVHSADCHLHIYGHRFCSKPVVHPIV